MIMVQISILPLYLHVLEHKYAFEELLGSVFLSAQPPRAPLSPLLLSLGFQTPETERKKQPSIWYLQCNYI